MAAIDPNLIPVHLSSWYDIPPISFRNMSVILVYKIKFYFGVKGSSLSDAGAQLGALKEAFLQLFRED